MRRLAVAAAVASLCAAPAAHARPGDLDRTFSKDGKVGFNPYKLGGTTRGLTLLDGRRPLLSVQAQRGPDAAPTWVSFSPAGRITGRVPVPPPAFYAATLANGYALTEYRPDTTAKRYALARIGAPESAVLTLPPDAWVSGFGVDGRGRAVLGGNVKGRARIWRFLPDGTPDPSFSGDGRVELNTFGDAGDLVVKPDGRVFLADDAITALDASGNRLAGFHHGSVLPPRRLRLGWAPVTRLLPAPDGGFLVLSGGDYDQYAWVSRRRPDGRLDTRWGNRGFVAKRAVLENASLSTATFDRHGRVLLAGHYLRESYGFSAMVVRLTTRGLPDRRFASRGRKVLRLADVPGVRDIDSSGIGFVEVDVRGRIVVAGNVYGSDYIDREDYGNPYPAIARLRGS